MTKNRVYVVDDDPSVRKGLARLLRSGGYEVEAFESAAAFLQRDDYAGPACILLDLCMPALNGRELHMQLRDAGSTLPIIFLSGHAELGDGVRAMKDGAVDFLVKPVDEEVLLSAIRTALARHGEALAEARETRAIECNVGSLTERELETARWVIAGLRNKQIAAELGIAEKTVKIHRARVMQKMGATSLPGLVRLLERVGIRPMIPKP